MDRNTLLAKLNHDDDLCAGCGIHSALISADDLLLSPSERVCEMCAAMARVERRLRESDKAYEESRKPTADEKRPSDGRRIGVAVRPAKKPRKET